MGSISSHVLCFSHRVLTNLYLIQDSPWVAHGADESRSPGLQRHHSVPFCHSPGRSSARGIFHSPPARQGASNIQQRDLNQWISVVENQNSIRTPGSAQTDPTHDSLVASAPPWENDIHDSPAADGLVSHVGVFEPPISTEYPPWGVYIHDSHPNDVSGEEIFPQSRGPLIQPAYQAHSAGLVFQVEPPQSNHTQLSWSGSQGVSLIVSGDYVRSETLALWLC